jgi:hypothetical protein
MKLEETIKKMIGRVEVDIDTAKTSRPNLNENNLCTELGYYLMAMVDLYETFKGTRMGNDLLFQHLDAISRLERKYGISLEETKKLSVDLERNETIYGKEINSKFRLYASILLQN